MILVFDLGGPLLAYGLLRSAGTSAVTALVISGVLPALGIAVGTVAYRRLDIVGVVVLAGLLVGTLLSLTSHDARLYLLESSVTHRYLRRRQNMTAGPYTLVRCLAP
jgi:hypothetical protein